MLYEVITAKTAPAAFPQTDRVGGGEEPLAALLPVGGRRERIDRPPGPAGDGIRRGRTRHDRAARRQRRGQPGPDPGGPRGTRRGRVAPFRLIPSDLVTFSEIIAFPDPTIVIFFRPVFQC